ncbi:hypothetical protein V5F53_15155 [Xanthobacter sp. V4C-4]|uniref:hypothetical protein n=1 Tax=Xanthobacter cornucopiae TaxID=3119924 RepID=UPI0037296D39
MNLKESARQFVLHNLPFDRNDAETISYLSRLDASLLLAVYHNWLNRLVRPQPRQVLQSQAFIRNPVVLARQADINGIVVDVERGFDLTKYLSRGVKIGAQSPAQKRRQDLDLMLNQWGIHHLHLSSEVESDGFVKRDGPVIFAMFRTDKAFFIDVMGHGDWTRDHVLETLVDEWPNEGLIHQLRGAEGLSRTISESDRAVLRKKHANAAFEYKGKVYMPDGLLSSAGTSVDSIREADRVVIAIEDFERRAAVDSNWLPRIFAANGITYPTEPKFAFTVGDEGVAVLEESTGAIIPLLR